MDTKRGSLIETLSVITFLLIIAVIIGSALWLDHGLTEAAKQQLEIEFAASAPKKFEAEFNIFAEIIGDEKIRGENHDLIQEEVNAVLTSRAWEWQRLIDNKSTLRPVTIERQPNEDVNSFIERRIRISSQFLTNFAKADQDIAQALASFHSAKKLADHFGFATKDNPKDYLQDQLSRQ